MLQLSGEGCNDHCHTPYTIEPMHCHTLCTIAPTYCHTPCTIVPTHCHTLRTTASMHCHTYTISPMHLSYSLHHCNHAFVILLTPLQPCIVIVFTPFTHPQPIVLVHLVMTYLDRHGQPYYWYILACHVRVDMGSHLIGTSFHGLSGCTSSAILLVHFVMACPVHHSQPNSIIPCCSLV